MAGERGNEIDQYEYEGLVRGLEAFAEKRPQAFRGRVLLLSGAAYVALFAALLLLGLLAWLFFDLVHGRGRLYNLVAMAVIASTVLPLFYAVLRMFFLRLSPPDGREITAADAPKLFSILDDLRRKTGGPRLDRVVVDRSFNAAIAQVPRWGLFGGHRNHLILGLPYLIASSPEEMLATVAHEYGHLAGDHGKLGAWVYRQRRTFGALQEVVQARAAEGGISSLFASAINAFAPYFNAYTFALSRQNEYEADAVATRVVGAGPNAAGLVRGDLQSRWLHEDFWPRLYAQAGERPEPLFKPFSALRTAFAASYEQWASADRLRQACAVDSGVSDTHPCLRERLAAIGQAAKLPPPVTRTAADVLLGPLAQKLVREFDQSWWQDEQAAWGEHHRRTKRSRARIAELSARPLATLDVAELQELAVLLSDFDTPESAKPALEHLLDRPGGPFPKANFLYGRILLHEKDSRGLEQLRVAARASAALLDDCVRVGCSFLEATQGEDAAHAWWEDMAAEFAGDDGG